MFDKLRSYLRHPLVQQFRDVRAVGLLAFAVIALLVSWSGVQVIETNYALQQQIARLEEQNKLQELQNANQKYRNEYFNTDEYLELQARKQFGKAAPGEKLLLIPKDVALAKTVELPQAERDAPGEESPRKPAYQTNFEAWMDFFFHRTGR